MRRITAKTPGAAIALKGSWLAVLWLCKQGRLVLPHARSAERGRVGGKLLGVDAKLGFKKNVTVKVGRRTASSAAVSRASSSIPDLFLDHHDIGQTKTGLRAW